jgi:PucR C-terminal helix-turn-helix domain/GGDEF-like domain
LAVTRQQTPRRSSADAKAVARIVTTLREQVEQLTDAAMQEIFSEIPAYETTLDRTFVDDVREHVREHYLAALASVERGRAVTAEDLLFVRKHAAQRVGQVSVADFIHAFQVGQHVLLDAAISLADDDASRRAVLSLLALIPRYFDVAIAHAADVYLEAEELLASTGERLRRDLLEDLLAGAPPPPGPRLDAARAAGLDQRSGCLVIAARPTASVEDPHALRAAATALARATQRPVAPLAVVRHDEIVVVAPGPSGDAGALADRLGDTQGRLAAGDVSLAIALSTEYDGLATVGDAYREAVSALDRLLPSPGVIALPAMTMFDYLTMHGDRTARRMVPPAIERFVAEDLDSGGALLATLRAYADADLSAKRAAEELHIHVNTAHYRLARIAERTGCDLRRVGDVIELLIAARLASAPAGARS